MGVGACGRDWDVNIVGERGGGARWENRAEAGILILWELGQRLRDVWSM